MRKLLIFFVGVFVASAAFAAIVEPEIVQEKCDSVNAEGCENADIRAYVTNTPFSWGNATDAGNVLGIVVCSYVGSNTTGYIADSKETSTLNTDRASWASGDDPTGGNCWCKMESPGESSWLYNETFKDVKDCTNSCSFSCSAILNKNGVFRHTMYSTLPPPNPWDAPITQSTGGCTDEDGKACNNSSTATFVGNNIMSWAAEYDRERINIMGVSVCSTPTGVAGDIATAAATTTLNTDRTAQASGDDPTGGNCWCKMELPGESSWVLGEKLNSTKECSSDCSGRCKKEATYFNGLVLKSMYATMVQPRTVTTQTYVGRIFDALQPKITTTGVNKLMLYGGTAGAILARDIVTTLGNNTNATTVSTTGAVVTGAGTKQDALNGTNGWVATGTSDPVVFGQKPVYDGAGGSIYASIYALTPAGTINLAARDGANSELVCARYVANAAPTPANCLLWKLAPYDVGGAAIPDLKRGFADLGEYCTQDNDCISYNCGDDNLCEDNDLKVTYIGGRCYQDSECVSGFCDHSVIRDGICAPMGCTAAGGNCDNDRECCSGVCNGGKCATARAAGYYCTDAANCASGNCTKGRCTEFLPDGAECKNDAECISTSHCVNGRCRGDCAIAEESCLVNADCCSGVCRPGSIHGEYICADACATVGSACSSSSDCCGNSECTNGTCTAATGMNGDRCNTTADCWNGWCDNGTCTAGRANGVTCSTTEQCLDRACTIGKSPSCSSDSILKGGNGDLCTMYNQCNSYFCQDGVCVAAPVGAFCTENSNCASGSCTKGVCIAALPVGRE